MTQNYNYYNSTTVMKIIRDISNQFIGFKPFNDDDVIIVSVLLITFMVFGIVANLLTIAVIVTSHSLNSVFFQFILSLCASDLFSALISWINLYRRTWGYDNFALSNFLCVLYRSCDVWTSMVTALHILSFAILRLISVKWPMILKKITLNHGKIWIALLWLVGFFCGCVPMIIFNGARIKDRAANTPDSKWPACTQLHEWLAVSHKYTLIVYSIFFYGPILCICLITVWIILEMAKRRRRLTAHFSVRTQNRRRSTERQAIFQLGLIVGSFLIGYLPFTAFEFYTYNQHNDSYETRWIDWHFGTYQYICLRFSECLNPLLYNLGSKKMREETKRFVYRRFLSCCNSTRHNAVAPERPMSKTTRVNTIT